ncbi:MAG: glucosyltransferase domain-containing protein [Eubacteriales bacterium]|nr:glucosyltransferase domain-containing protein [Eubacteriales bacterium]
MNLLSDTIDKNKKTLLICLISVFLWGLAAHNYGFVHSSFSHDSLYEFNGDGLSNYIRLINGRFLSPVCRKLFRTDLTLPWLIGVLGLLWIALSVFFTAKLFRLEHPVLLVVLSGFFAANLTVSSTIATFIHDFDCDMLALLFSVLAVFCWQKGKWGFLPGAVFVMCSLALYQSYICVSITLVMLVCMMALLDSEGLGTVLIRGLRGCAMLLLGGGLYYVALKIVTQVMQVSLMTDAYNSLDRPLQIVNMSWFDIKYTLKETYTIFFERLTQVLSPFPVVTRRVTKMLLRLSVVLLAADILLGRVRLGQTLLLLVLTALLPLGMNLMHLMTLGGTSHELMIYAYWLTYLVPLLLGHRLIRHFETWEGKWKARTLPVSRWIQAASIVMVLVLVCGNVQTANVLYLKKDMEQDAYLSVMTRVVYRMEETEGYVPGETPVVMVGLPQQINEVIPGFEAYRKPNGMWMSDVLNFGDAGHWSAYFKYILQNPSTIVAGDQLYTDPRVEAMPCYPAQGCTALIDGTLVVKLGTP